MGLSRIPEGAFGEPTELDPYLPFPEALRARIITAPEALAVATVANPGVSLLRRQIPNHKGAGIVPTSRGFAAFDLTAGEKHGKFVDIYPASKRAVSHDGTILGEGLVPLEGADDLLKITALAVRASARPWLIDDFASRIPVHQLMAEVVVVPFPVLDSPQYERHEDLPGGGTRYKQVAHYL